MTTQEDELLHNLRQTFQIEAVDHLDSINQSLLQYEQTADPIQRETLVQTAFRAAHSLKGAARAVSSDDVASLAHALESVLQQARQGQLSLTPAIGDVLYDTLDMINRVLENDQPDQTVLAAMYTRLSHIGANAPAAEVTAAPAQVETTPVQTSAAYTEETIRVAISKLDSLMAQTGELMISKVTAAQHIDQMNLLRREMELWPKSWRMIRTLLPRVDAIVQKQLTEILTQHYDALQDFGRRVSTLQQSISQDTLRLGLVTDRLQEEVRAARMVPFQTLIAGLQRAMRDAARTEDKQIAPLHIDGGSVELDKKILEALKDPLLHLLRNAVSHGIETQALRTAAGKQAEGHISISVHQRGSEVRIAVRDDGRGFDLSALRKASQKNGHAPLDENASPDDVIAFAFSPGITTADQLTVLSGRGIGLDVVRQMVESLQGRVQVESTPGQGTSIQLVVPVSLSMTRGLLIQVGNERYILPLLAIEKIIVPQDIFTVEGQPMLMIDGKSVRLNTLAAILERPVTVPQDREKPLALVLAVGDQRLALVVDDILTEYELPVKPLGKLFQNTPNVAGAALLGNGEPIVVLNPADLVRSARRTANVVLPVQDDKAQPQRPTVQILIVDDSITTRTLEKNILEAAGYRVITATDGLGAIKRLKENQIDLVVSDVQMPSMDGIALTRYLRESAAYQQLPLILVTSLESAEDRERGLLAGANAYIVKRGFNQAELLSTIQQFL
jgi:two-component system chemotaxis sensor kinase CheA